MQETESMNVAPVARGTSFFRKKRQALTQILAFTQHNSDALLIGNRMQ